MKLLVFCIFFVSTRLISCQRPTMVNPYNKPTLSANVLIMHPIYCGSHELVLRKFGEELTKTGHKVTQVRWKSVNSKEPKDSPVKVITLAVNNSDKRYPYISQDGSFQPPTKLLWDTPRHMWQVPLDVFQIIDAQCKHMFEDRHFISRIRAQNFTVAVVDVLSNECSLALLHHLGIPVIGFWGFILVGTEPRYIGVYQPLGIFPAWASELGKDVNFLDRIWNTVAAMAEYAIVTYHLNVVDSYIKKYLPEVPLSRDLLGNLDALLVQTNWYLDYPKLLPPNIEYIGCLQCGEPHGEIPKELQNWYVGSGTNGVVLFSLGFTGYDSSMVPDSIMTAFIDAFERLPQKFLLRFDPSSLKRIPSNIKAVQWFPQHDLLADPRTKLLISHCGINGLNEALYHSVPMVCIPIFSDQGDNAVRITEKGYGLALDKDNLNSKIVYDVVSAVLSNSSFYESVKRYSEMWKSEERDSDKARKWVERVHKFGNLNHLKIKGGHLYEFQYLGLDAYLFLICIFSVFFIAFYKISRWCFCTTRRKDINAKKWKKN